MVSADVAASLTALREIDALTQLTETAADRLECGFIPADFSLKPAENCPISDAFVSVLRSYSHGLT